MKKPLRTLSVLIDPTSVKIEHDASSYLKIYDAPRAQSYPHEERGVWNDINVLQYIPMMDFQAKISMIFRSAIREVGYQLPLLGIYNVEISIESSRNINGRQLLLIMKSILDGINKLVVASDQFINSAAIGHSFKASTKRTAISQSPDLVTIELYEVGGGGNQKLIHSVRERFYCEPKVEPLFLDWGHSYFPLEYQYTDPIIDGLQKDGMQIAVGGPMQVQMSFQLSDMSKDIDNMAIFYYAILEGTGLRDDDVYSIRLKKTKSATEHTEIELL
ncbi:hypothetical protein [Paenibacillus thalictri]|uniref:Uncharacterized protein n=1 Tax=Paenibacillus thalictri TaxID=2527873 RepID=A0A4Q9DGF3_9BACL|nr:hypothetical protein [Paenibacillus thalictri]TBL69783.1 hypothetical protein EYB31_34990 [Paenibacillus thalictri]